MRRLDRADALPLLGALPVLGVFAWWTADDGGYARAVWMPGLVVMAIVLSMTIALAPRRPSRAAMLALAALAAYTAWSFASILWATAPGPALDGSLRTLLYLVCFACFALLPWTPRALLVVLGLFVSVITVVSAVLVLRVAQADDPTRFFFAARLIGPLGYPNAAAALWTTAALPALVLASRSEVAWWLRPLFLGASGFLLGLALMAESRGWLVTLPLVAVVTLLLVPGRGRLIVFAAITAGVVALTSGDLLSLYRDATGLEEPALRATLEVAFDEAWRALLVAAGALVVVGALATLVDAGVGRLLRPRPRLARGLSAAAVLCAAVTCAGAAIVATDGRPLDRVDRAWTEFTSYHGEGDEGRRFTSLGSNRHEQWRVALLAAREHPIGGLGQDNFAQTYIRERRNTFDEARWTHSLPLRLLAHTGFVGALLFVLCAVAAAWAAVSGRSRRGGPDVARVAASAALLPAVVWIAHGSVDWLWEYPGLSGPALALAGAATALPRGAVDHDEEPPEAQPVPRRSRLRVVLACAAALACAAIVLPSYVADRDVRVAAEEWPADPGLAFERLERARTLNPLDAQASLVEGVIAVRTGRLERARTSFERAARREPHDWYSRFQLGLVAGALRDWPRARRALLEARRLNPRDELVTDALELARSRRAMSFDEAQEELDRRSTRGFT